MIAYVMFWIGFVTLFVMLYKLYRVWKWEYETNQEYEEYLNKYYKGEED